MRIKPLSDRVLLSVPSRRRKSGRDHYPGHCQGEAAGSRGGAVGDGKLDDNGKRIAMSVKKGNRVLIASTPARTSDRRRRAHDRP